jgi:hypothetical protein
MKANPYSLILPKFKTITRTFTHYAGKEWLCSCGKSFDGQTDECPFKVGEDPHHAVQNEPQVQFSMTLKVLTQMEAMGIQGLVDKMRIKYLDGYGEKGKQGYVAPIVMAPVGDMPVKMNYEVCRTAAIIFSTQIAPEDEKYSFEEICSWMMSDRICAEMLQASVDVQGDGDDEDPLASPA